MTIRPRSKGLRELLAQLARFFRANETTISAEHVSTCLEHLPANERSALDRLIILVQTLGSELAGGRRGGGANDSHAERPSWDPHNDSLGAKDDNPGEVVLHNHAREPQSSPTSHGLCNHEPNSSNPGDDHTDDNQSPLPLPHENDDDQSGSAHVVDPAHGDLDIPAITPCLSFGQQPASSVTALPAAGLATLQQAEIVALPAASDDSSICKEGLATCSEVQFAPSTSRLLEACRIERGQFLRAIREAKAALPTGQGWEAAIATKRENADIRDLMKIYHRFECYNIYRHVVEAGFHTGTHWIRDMRTTLAKKLCKDFPERFPIQKTANRSLSWVDQGCKYHEWAGMFNESPDLGYLIALPSDVSHSAYVSFPPKLNIATPTGNSSLQEPFRYTSRCTKEQMKTATKKFKDLGIDDLVEKLELSELGNHIAATLRDMTSKKRKDVEGGCSGDVPNPRT
ncbi:MAG: hypothetical protein Q9222_000823 [Ikaeria aurantiellina]